MKQEIRRKVIEGIQPFNLFFYHSCFYHQLIAAYSCFDVSPQTVMADFKSCYVYDESISGIRVVQRSVRKKERFEEITGVKKTIISYKNVKDLCAHIKSNIDGGSPVIALVDCFYLPYRPDVFNTFHDPHYILVYGYDADRRDFICLDHHYAGSCHYRETYVPFDVLSAAAQPYFSDCPCRLSNLTQLRPLPNKARAVRPDVEYSQLRASKTDMRNLRRALAEMLRFAENADAVTQEDTVRYDWLHRVRLNKLTQRHLITCFFQDEQAIALLDRLTVNYAFIFGVLYKAKCCSAFSEKSKVKLSERIAETLLLEKEVNKLYDERANTIHRHQQTVQS